MIVADASAMVAALTDRTSTGRWAVHTISTTPLVAPHLMPAEAANIIRRALAWGDLSDEAANAAIQELVTVPLSLEPYHPFADRVWELRENVTVYDAWYVAVAEQFGCPLATLDRRLARADGPRCEFLLPS